MNNRISAVRAYLHLTMEEFGNAIGLSRPAISNIESGKRSLTDRNIQVICNVFNVNENWLRYGKGEMFDNLNEIEKIGKKYSLSKQEIIAIEKFIQLDPKVRKGMLDYFQNIASAMSTESSEEDLHADLQREIDSQKKVEEKSIGSASTSA